LLWVETGGSIAIFSNGGFPEAWVIDAGPRDRLGVFLGYALGR
jgi:hypothetical protein